MSLVITSNEVLEDRPDTSNAFKPYSYQNRLLNTMRIPPNSEIALQSAKINKNGLFVLDRANSGFNHYFGTRIDSDAAIPDLSYSTTQAFPAVIGAGEAFRAGGKTEKNVDDLAVDVELGLSKASFHPSLINGSTTASIKVNPLINTSGGFQGYKFDFTQQTAKTKRNATSIQFTDVSLNNNYPFTQANGVVTATDVNGFYVQNREYPISQNAGECVFDFKNSGSQFMAGLSRVNIRREFGGGDDYDYLPNYFDFNVGDHIKKQLMHRGQFQYADICVMIVKGALRVFQSGSRTAAGSKSGIMMNEVKYWESNAAFTDAYDYATNASNFEKVKFTLTNEELQIDLIDDKAATQFLVDYTTSVAAGGVKNEVLNPVGAPKWAMYPVCGISGGTGTGSIELEYVEHYTNYPVYSDTGYLSYDWWGYSQFSELTRFCQEVEMRDWNNYSRTVSGTLGNGLLAPKLLNASGGMADYDNILITAQSEEYGEVITGNANTSRTLGFEKVPVSANATGGTNVLNVVESISVPKLISNVSLFIRLNNFTQNTMNAKKGTLSKIVAHLPRFDNSGNETGGLYFEPHEKTYLALNNPDEILINSFDIDIVYDNETLCTALSGKTIVCFHIRPSRK
jgi:hypothetical protein